MNKDKLREQFHKQRTEVRNKWEALTTEELKEALVKEFEANVKARKETWFFSFKLMQEFGETEWTAHCVNRDKKVWEVAKENLERAKKFSTEWTRKDCLLHFVEGRMWRFFKSEIVED